MQLQQFLPDPPVRQTALAGGRLMARDAVPGHAVYLKHGRVAAGQMDTDAMRHRLVTIEGPCWLDVGPVLFNTACTADWVAETDVELLMVPADALRKWFNSQPAPMRSLMRDTFQAQRQQTEATLAMMVQDAEARCAQWLLRHAEVSDHGVVAVTMKERKRAIAAQLGIAPETLSRVLRHLRELGLISQTGSVMNLIDPSGLKAVASR